MKKHKMCQNKSLASSLPSFRPDLRQRPRGLAARERSRRFGRGSLNGIKDLRFRRDSIASLSGLHKSKKVTLIDALDRVIDKGAYVDGELVLRVADVDLIFIGLRLIVTSISNAERLRNEGKIGKRPNSTVQDLAQIKKLEQQLKDIKANIPKIIEASDPQKAEQGIAKLVLILIELIRQLLEREAVRRVDTGTLTDAEIQKLGLTFKALEKKIQEMKTIFGIKEELNLELGPLGNLL
jgi:hypothetical protein